MSCTENNGNECEMEGPTEASVNLLLAVLLPGIIVLLLGLAILIVIIILYRWKAHRQKSIDIDRYVDKTWNNYGTYDMHSEVIDGGYAYFEESNHEKLPLNYCIKPFQLDKFFLSVWIGLLVCIVRRSICRL